MQKHSFYFAYGSNLHLSQMRQRCPQARPICQAVLEGWELKFANVLTIERKKGAEVVGAIYRTYEGDRNALDRYEGYPYFYGVEHFTAKIGGNVEQVYVYVMNDPYNISPPSASYEKTVRQGYADWGLPMEHLDNALKHSYEQLRTTGWEGAARLHDRKARKHLQLSEG